MAVIKIKPSGISGIIKAPPSKSIAHRALFCAALSGAPCTLTNVGVSDDVQATIACLSKMGVSFRITDDGITVDGSKLKTSGEFSFHCRESGATLRYAIPTAAVLGYDASFYGSGNLPNRSVEEFKEMLPKYNVSAFKRGGEILSVSGKLSGDAFSISTESSSQFLSGLMLSLPYLRKETSIKLSTEVSHSNYIQPTVAVQSIFGVEPKFDEKERTITVPSANYTPADYAIEGDYSLAACYLVAGAIGDGVTVDGLPSFSHQAERRLIHTLRDCGANVIQADTFVSVSRNKLSPIDVDCAEIPDLVPILAVLACYANGRSRLENCGHLYYKESDRLHFVCNALTALGADIEAVGGDLIILGKGSLDGGHLASDFGDHRIAMALAIAAAFADEESEIDTDNTVKKSYPAFFSDYVKLGGKKV